MAKPNDTERQPLLSPNTSLGSYDGSPKSKFRSEATRTGSPDSTKHHSSITDFDQADSWGILHETEGNGGSKDDRDTFIDHRPTMSRLASRSKSASHNNAHRASLPAILTKSHSSRKAKGPEAPQKSSLARLSRSELKEWADNGQYGGNPYDSGLDQPKRRNTLAGDDVVIDVDELMQHVHNKNANNSSKSSRSLGSSNEEGYNSRPSSRGSSTNSSLDDVCLYLEDEGATEGRKWPDVSVLEEFSKEETEKLRRQALKDAEEFHFQYDEEDELDEETGTSDGIFFSKPIVTSIDVPELGNKRVNEAEQLRSGRLRPKKIAPWHLKRALIPSSYKTLKDHTKINNDNQMRDNFLVGRNIQYPPHIVSNNPEHFRFTYFRVDLDATVHSPTVSGLLQPGQKFEELFVHSVYSGNFARRKSETPSLTKSSTPFAGQGSAVNPSSATLNNNRSSYNLPPSSPDDEDDISPFWLDVLNPTEEEMKVLSKAFGIHPLTTEDIFLGEAREKVELFRDYYLVCFRSFDIVAERHTRKKRLRQDASSPTADRESLQKSQRSIKRSSRWFPTFRRRRRSSTIRTTTASTFSNRRRRNEKEREEKEKYKRKSGDRHKPRQGELEPLNVYIIVFRTGVLTFHFAPTPHPINVRRRARLLKDYLNVTSDWIAYALIDDITDSFAPMIELIEDEVYDIEDAILRMHHSDDSSDDQSDDSEGSDSDNELYPFDRSSHRSAFTKESRSTMTSSSRSRSTDDSTFNVNLIGWKKKGDMLRRIGECRKRVMSILRLLGSKADVIKGFAKRCNERWEVAPRSEIGMYLGDIQDHIITMVSSLNHYEKLLSRSHSNYLAQINIDMTKVNNDMNDVLGKITILGTVVLPMNVITGLWGMNVIVPGQYNDSLTWFASICAFMVLLAYTAYVYTKRRFGF
ncbi:hypothetical protein HG536_0G00850 [Torulaspora globosa]|uniref:Manganese resistance protein MNR2 n=1 Tax=Torulaspora globosa TaxID=48254 RepID=A0A7G3ZL42_9SACH|nr:uncharacterized protein HG536_0G00850 [Torulaspora globosa]QLL34228.1 hypothetical protein HG536_0G00850 [Torulaspora globosa]